MKDLFLVPIILMIFAFGYYVVKKAGNFIEENLCFLTEEDGQNSCTEQSGTETTAAIDPADIPCE